ncbi:hypothetical protein LG634_11075 [Streptomyces bambusae]|uniref:hypothetical protein n=1 Tax=Streptomyces bambusae TaxID=1550616 RepID=UPI001CFD7A7E|nr:hypothetical protein [Streptomyces bambusae]MCB5165371.1 hypothetical protein [Streptomyces bambusae]
MTAFLDERLTGPWYSAPYDVGAMETSDLVFLPDGSGWSRFESIGSEMAVTRFRWHCPGPGRLVLLNTWLIRGRWAAGSDGFAGVPDRTRDGTVTSVGYRIAPQVPPYGDEPVTTLACDEPVEFAHCFARGGLPVTRADDPSAVHLPYPPPPRPGPPPRAVGRR